MNTKQIHKSILSIIIMLCILTSTVPIYAAEHGQGSGANGTAMGTVNDGRDKPSFTKTGWLVYLVGTDGKLASKVAFVSSRSMTRDKLNTYNKQYLTSRVGNQRPYNYFTTGDCKWGEPFGNSSTARGKIIKNAIVGKKDWSEGQCLNSISIVIKYLCYETKTGKNKKAFDKYISGEAYLILEACAYHQLGDNGDWRNKKCMFSSSGIGRLQKEHGIPEIGDRYRWCDNEMLQYGCYLDKKWTGLPQPAKQTSGTVKTSTILGNRGYGLLAFRYEDAPKIQTTYDNISTIPSTAPTESKGKITVIKVYNEKKTETYTEIVPITDDDIVEDTPTDELDETLDEILNDNDIIYNPGEIAGSEVNNAEGEQGAEGEDTTDIIDPTDPSLNVSEDDFEEQIDEDDTIYDEYEDEDDIEYIEQEVTTTTYKHVKTFKKSSLTNKIKIENEMDDPGCGYQVVKWKITDKVSSKAINGDYLRGDNWQPAGNSLGDSKTSGGKVSTAKTVTVDSGNKCLYILLEKHEEEKKEDAEGNYDMSQSSITRRIYLSRPDKETSLSGNIMKNISNHMFGWYTDGVRCPGHGHSHCGMYYCSSHTTYCNWTWPDKNFKFSLWNSEKNNYPDILATKQGWNNETKYDNTLLGERVTKHFYRDDNSFNRTGNNKEYFYNKDWDYVCVLMRGKDKLTLSKWVNEGQAVVKETEAIDDLKDASSSGFKVDDKPQDTRQLKDYTDKFKAVFENDDITPTIDMITVANGKAGCGYACGTVTRKAYFRDETRLTVDVDVKVNVYSGKEKITPDKKVNKNTIIKLAVDGFNTSSGKMIASGANVKLYPYIRMKYDTLVTTDKTAYVMGQYVRELYPNDYAEISFNKKSEPNVGLFSAQWSTHAQALKDASEWSGSTTGEGLVLPGGVQHSLTMKKDDRQKMQVTTYQSIIEGAGETQIKKNGFSVPDELTRKTAEKEHDKYVETVIDTLNKTSMALYVDKNRNHKDADNGLKVTAGSDISSLENTNQSNAKASTNKKYYLRKYNDTTTGTKGTLETKYDPSTKTTETYTFFTMTDGTIWMSKNNTEPKEADLDKCIKVCEQNSKTIIDTKAKELNDRTYVVDKLRKSLEYKTGKDKTANKKEYNNWAKDGKWYNEAFDGITIIVQKSVIEVGFGTDREKSSILDPKLIPLNKGKHDLFTNYHVGQYYVDVDAENEKIGTFKGAKVASGDLKYLFYTKAFLIPNVTSQDLR